MILFGKVTHWNLIAWTLLCPLWRIRWLVSGLAIGLRVPSINPKQFSNGAPLLATASAYLCSASGFMTSGYHWQNFIGYQAQHWNCTCKSWHHVRVMNRVCQTFEKHTKCLRSICYASLIAYHNLWNLQYFTKQRYISFSNSKLSYTFFIFYFIDFKWFVHVVW